MLQALPGDNASILTEFAENLDGKPLSGSGDVVRAVRVPATMLVSAHGESMSVPRRCIGRPARIGCMPGGAMDCYVGGELVATHMAGGPAYDPAHYAELVCGLMQ